jgi:hypothetical protein
VALLNVAVANDAVVKRVKYCMSRKCHKIMNILILEVSQYVVGIIHLYPYVPKYRNVFILFFKLVSNISVEEHARKNGSFICIGISLDFTAYLLKLYISATVPLCDTVVLSQARHI